MISRKHGCLFVHIPKTGGQSVEAYFLALHGLDWESRGPLLLRHNLDPDRGPSRLAHLTAPEYLEFGYVGGQEFSQLFKFAFVRNPFDRLISEYRFNWQSRTYTFRDFVLNHFPTKDRYCDFYRHVMPQSDFIYDASGSLLVDFIGRFESIETDFYRLCEVLGLPRTPLPHRNRGSQSHVSHDAYDDELLAFTREFYSADFELLGYDARSPSSGTPP